MKTSRDLSIKEDKNKIFVQVPVPGMTIKDIKFHIKSGVLTVEATKEEKQEKDEGEKGNKIFYSSSVQSSYSYSTTLPSEINSSKIDPSLKDGVLTLEITKAK